MNDEQKIEIIMPEALVKVEVSTGYYQAIQEMMGFIIKDKTQDQITEAYAKIASKDLSEPWVAHLQTVLIFIKEFQKQAKEKGFVKSMTREEASSYLKEKFPDETDHLKPFDDLVNKADASNKKD